MLDVAIVGAGPVGLHLGALLLQAGLSVRILEQLPAPRPESRAIGIHPPALAALALAGVAAPVLAEGVHITAGTARSGGSEVGRVAFDPPVLTLKQVRTEAILARRVSQLDPGALVRGFCLKTLHDGGTFLTLSASHGTHIQARLVVGADGARSAVRRLLGIATGGRDHPDTYLMGDFPDTGSDGATAVLHLEPGGIVESFPLPDGLRRWVAHTDSLLEGADAATLARIILARTGMSVDAGANSMLSAFGVRTRLARRMVQGRVALVGDAAHEISPIGGQGMNLGWLDAAALAPIVVDALAGRATGARLAGFERDRMGAARTAARQAQLNMVLGRAMPPSFLQWRNGVLGRIFTLPSAQNLVARRFTMQ